jgi:predicted alpha/beta-fold hydrolase
LPKQANFCLDTIKNCTDPLTFTNLFTYKYHQHINPEKFDTIENFFSYLDSTPFIKSLKHPSLLISAKTDPISKPSLIPWEEISQNENIVYAYTPRGGHLEYMTGWERTRWYKKTMVDFINSINEYDDSTEKSVKA